MKTAIQQVIEKFEHIQKNDCKTLPEVVFFNGVLAILETVYLDVEKHQIMDAYKYAEDVAYADSEYSAEQYFNEKYMNP